MSMQVRTVGAYLWSLAQGTLVLGALLVKVVAVTGHFKSLRLLAG
ncbi:hypothetical protein [Levilactobacillus brevis]|nr:hypothetical protein [Levilactobacillus brevis]